MKCTDPYCLTNARYGSYDAYAGDYCAACRAEREEEEDGDDDDE